jgi:Cu(I)/Ag(I) efflux system periplasmic protein CusF
MHKFLLAAVLGLGLSCAAIAHEGRATVSGVITKMDLTAGKVTLKHEAMPNLNMDAMTMVYPVKDPAMLKGLKAGDKVKFEAEEIDGQANVVEIEKAK